ncbi:lipid kinase, YegS/Rv2252/BmrU family [Pustulibacterium marinum]|uniref:Lipid kinase, YegS/Rv2252/BmrU family n=1 Tax=Pustulibacterium marinum TaxID=1224947 RepID=A0A1I7I2R9_9FLAO|nr:diacylglycerol kinase family protein [Pustulibacterium marinum]SFU67253.1 lipid kinase, YegS/Rv2252/BmrU family [Pustulibacterium marinum]
MQQKLWFIINPKAGIGKISDLENQLGSHFSAKKYSVTYAYTAFSKHAASLAATALKDGAHIIVACGGDGTINEVASVLVGQSVLFGCIPLGSGNGLASHLNIPKNIAKAAEVLVKGKVKRIDVGKVNNSFFFSNAGFGFDTRVLEARAHATSSPFLNYAHAVVKAFFKKWNLEEVEIVTAEGTSFTVTPFLVMITNSNQLGYQISLHREASVTDGMLDLIIIDRKPKLAILWMTLLVLLRKENYCRGLRHVKVKSVEIMSSIKNNLCIQQDGELRYCNDGSLHIEIMPAALQVIC